MHAKKRKLNDQLHFISFQSLKKEIDWDRSDEKSIGEYSSEYRHQHDSVSSVLFFFVAIMIQLLKFHYNKLDVALNG